MGSGPTMRRFDPFLPSHIQRKRIPCPLFFVSTFEEEIEQHGEKGRKNGSLSVAESRTSGPLRTEEFSESEASEIPFLPSIRK